MNLLETIMQAQGGGAVRQVAQQFGIGEDQVQSALGAVLPMLAGAVQQNVQSGGLEGLLGALQSGDHDKYLNNPSALTSQQGIEDGNGILGHLLGGKEVSRQLATHAAAESGVSSAIIKQLLPVAASLLMGGMSRQAGASGLLGQALGAAMGGGGGGGIASMIGSLLGGGGAPEPQQASAADGILGMLGPLLGGGGGGAQQPQQSSGLQEVLGLAAQLLSRR